MKCLNNCNEQKKHRILRMFCNLDYDANKIFSWLMSNKEATNNNVCNNIHYFCANCEMASIIIEIALFMPIFSLYLFSCHLILLSAIPLAIFFIDLDLFIKIASIPLSNTFSYLFNGIKYYISSYFFALSIIIVLIKNNSIKYNSLISFIIQNSGSIEIILLSVYIIGVLLVIHHVYPDNKNLCSNVRNKKDFLYVKPKGYKYVILWLMRVNTMLFFIFIIRVIINLI